MFSCEGFARSIELDDDDGTLGLEIELEELDEDTSVNFYPPGATTP
jgi:hypothetical protein